MNRGKDDNFQNRLLSLPYLEMKTHLSLLFMFIGPQNFRGYNITPQNYITQHFPSAFACTFWHDIMDLRKQHLFVLTRTKPQPRNLVLVSIVSCFTGAPTVYIMQLYSHTRVILSLKLQQEGVICLGYSLFNGEAAESMEGMPSSCHMHVFPLATAECIKGMSSSCHVHIFHLSDAGCM